MSGSAFAVTHHAFSSGAGRTSDGNGSHASTLKSPSYTKSVSWQHYPAPDNLIARDFKAEQPNQKWLTDITEFQLPAGKVWLSPVVDCFDGKVVSWSLSTRPDAELVNTMLDSAVETLNAGERPVIHSDRGGHYRWPGWLERVNAAGLIRSMSRKGCSPDNAACEGFFGRLKTEMYYGRKWSGITPEKFMQHVDAYIRWYNERRIKLSLGAVSPEMYRQQCGLE